MAAMKVMVVLLPSSKFENLARKYSSLIVDRYPSYFRLDNGHLPHTTLTSPEFTDESFDKINHLVENLSKETNKIIVAVNQIETDGSGFIGAYFQNDT